VCLAPIEGLTGLTETTSETVVDECELQDALESLQNAHLALAGRSIGANFDFARFFGLLLALGGGGNFLFSVRL